MSYFKTAILLAGLTALFMGVGYLIGGAGGAVAAEGYREQMIHGALQLEVSGRLLPDGGGAFS